MKKVKKRRRERIVRNQSTKRRKRKKRRTKGITVEIQGPEAERKSKLFIILGRKEIIVMTGTIGREMTIIEEIRGRDLMIEGIISDTTVLQSEAIAKLNKTLNN